MYGEPSAYEYGRMLQEANDAISTEGFRCHHVNTGWVGYYIQTPKGNKYQLVKRDLFRDTGYYLCDYDLHIGDHGRSLGLNFIDLNEAKEWLSWQEKD